VSALAARLWVGALALACMGEPASALAHGVDSGTQRFLLSNEGQAIVPFLYIGAKHMITGYDHLLFLIGVIFFLYRSKDILTYVSFFTLGHSLTLMAGVWYGTSVNPYLIDAIIGFSIVYKGFDNLGGFRQLLGFAPNPQAAVLIFGLFHGLGLATKLQEFELAEDGLLANLVAFNVGVELGQFSALALILIAIAHWRRHESFLRFSAATNALLMSGGMIFIGYQLTGFFTI
jgi:hypothetical protein